MRTILDEVLLIPVRGELAGMERIYFTNQIGVFVWELFDGVRNLGEMRAAIVERYAAAEDLIAADLLELVDALRNAGLISESP